MKSLANSPLARNAGWMLLGQGLGYGLRVAYFMVIARLLGVLQYGIIVGAFSLVNLVAQYSRLGSGMVLLRYVSASPSRFAAYWGNMLTVTTLTCGALVFLLRVLAPHVLDPASAAVIVFLAIGSCFCEEITIGATQAFQAHQQMRLAALVNQLTSLLRTVAAIGMLLALHRATAREWAMASMSASIVTMFIALGLVTVRLGWPRFTPHLAWAHGVEGVEYSFAASTTSAYNDLDKTMMSHYGMSVANGIYGMAYRIIEMGSIPIASIQIASEPRLFELAETGMREPIALGRRLFKHTLLISTATSIAMFVLAPAIPFLVGRDFGETVSALRWLCLIPIFRSIHGVTGTVLTCIGLQRYRTLTQIIVLLLNFGLNLWLIPLYGWQGAAWSSLATDGTLGVLNWSILSRKSKQLTRMALEGVAT